jgi:site-specific recombinase XerC
VNDRQTRKPSAHTVKAYRQDFVAIAALLAGDPLDLVRLPLAIIDTEAMRSAFAEYAHAGLQTGGPQRNDENHHTGQTQVPLDVQS